MESRANRRTCFIEEEEDDGPGFSGNYHHTSFVSGGPLWRRGSQRNLPPSSPEASSPRYGRFYVAGYEDERQPHFLDTCFLCKKSIGGNSDIFMYRGNVPFCSEECRQEQIEIDESKEKKSWNLSASMQTLRKKSQGSSTSPNKAQDGYSLRKGAVAAA